MPIKQCRINRFVSILYRCSRCFYDRRLERYQVTSGLPFFLLRISESPGLTLSELAEKGRFDKATTQRAAKKLQQLGYISIATDSIDGRVRRMNLTPAAQPLLEECYQMLEDWQNIITQRLTPQEVTQAEHLLQKISDNAYSFLRDSKKGMRP